MPKVSGVEAAITKANGVAALAAMLSKEIGEEVSMQAVTNWRARGVVPANRCRPIEKLTGVSVKRLRPKDWFEFWPEAATT